MNIVNFRRPKGAKDKEKRKRKIKGYAYIGLGGSIGSTVLGGASFLGAGHYYHKKYPTDTIEQILKPRPKNLNKKIAIIGLGGSLIGGALGARSVYKEHKDSPYSPIGKKEWKYKPYLKQ